MHLITGNPIGVARSIDVFVMLRSNGCQNTFLGKVTDIEDAARTIKWMLFHNLELTVRESSIFCQDI